MKKDSFRCLISSITAMILFIMTYQFFAQKFEELKAEPVHIIEFLMNIAFGLAWLFAFLLAVLFAMAFYANSRVSSRK